MNHVHKVIFSRFLGTLAFQILGFFGFFQAYALTKSPFSIGVVGMALFIPSVLMSIKVGTWADSVMKIGKTYFFLLILGMIPVLLFVVLPEDNYVLIIMSLSLLSLTRTIRGPFYYSVLKSLKKKSCSIAKLNTLSWQIPLVLGPFIVSLFHTLHIDMRGVLLIALLLQIGAAIIVFPLKTLEIEARTSVSSSLLESLKDLSIFQRKELFYPLFADVLLTGFMGLNAILPFLLSEKGIEDMNYGYYKSIFHLLSLLAVFSIRDKFLEKANLNHFGAVVFLWSGILLMLAISESNLGITLLIASLGALDGVSSLLRESFVFNLSSENELGRISSLNSLLVSVGDELGEFNTGWMVASFGVTTSLLLASAISLSAGIKIGQISRPPLLKDNA